MLNQSKLCALSSMKDWCLGLTFQLISHNYDVFEVGFVKFSQPANHQSGSAFLTIHFPFLRLCVLSDICLLFSCFFIYLFFSCFLPLSGLLFWEWFILSSNLCSLNLEFYEFIRWFCLFFFFWKKETCSLNWKNLIEKKLTIVKVFSPKIIYFQT